MKYHQVPFRIISALVYVLLIPINTSAQTEPNSPYQVRVGTLEVTKDPRRRYVFKSGIEEEAFDVSLIGRLGSSAMTYGLPDLTEVGFKTQDGKVYKYGGTPKNIFGEKWAKDNPGVEIVSIIFRTLLDHELEIKLQEPTPVVRVDIKENNGLTTTLWKNLSTPESSKK